MSDRSARDLLKLRREKSKARAKGELREFASFCNLIGEVLCQHGRYEDALLEHQEELETCELLSDKLGIAIAHRKIGEVHSELGRYGEALEHQQKHLQFARELKNTLEIQRALATIGRTHYFQAEALDPSSREYREALSQAQDSFEESLAVCQTLGESVPKREKMEMLARLFLNLGLIYEPQGNTNGSLDSLKKAIYVADKYQLTEDLHRCYYSLAAIYHRKNQLSQALRYAELAVAVATKLKDKALLCDDLALKAQLFLSLRDFEAAKRYLVKAYREKSPIEEDRKRITKLLRKAIKICRLQEKLANTSEYNHEDLLNVYEELGDSCASVKSFQAALDYYLRMLKEAELLGYRGKEFAPIYVSLSQTYMDLKDYENAVIYYKKELDLYADNPGESCRTLLNIANAREEDGATYRELEDLYNQAVRLAEQAKNRQLHAEALNSLAVLQDSLCMFNEGEETQKKLKDFCEEYGIDLNCEAESSSQETENDEDEDSIALSDLSDGDSDDESSATRPRKRPTRDLEKRNMKGETPLHRACIKQDLRTVSQLLAQGHQVNVRDYCGWSPLHEACNHGNVEIVRLLLKHGANVNDRGGSECEGVTPLHDAASCGHVDVMDALLKHGANAVARTDAGETPYECLVKWRLRTCGDLDEQTLAESLRMEARLMESLEKVGLNVPSVEQIERTQLQTSALIPEEEIPEEDSPPVLPVGPKRSSTTLDNPRDEYTSAIQRVGRSAARTVKETVPLRFKPSAKPKSGALVLEDEALDDWLVDDLNPTNRSKKTKRAMSDWTTGGSRRTNEKARDFPAFSSNGEKSPELLQLSPGPSSTISSPLRKRMKQTLIDLDDDSKSGNSEEDRSSPVLGGSAKANRSKRSPVLQSPVLNKEIEFSADTSNTTPSRPIDQDSKNVLRLRVRVNDRLLLVPVDRPESKNVEWLRTETARRFYSLTGLRPLLTMSTNDGALLSSEDPLSLVTGSDDEIVAIVNAWDLPPLHERYANSCRSLNVVRYQNIQHLMQSAHASGDLKLRGFSLGPAALLPVCRALQCQQTLRELDLSANKMDDSAFQHLCLALVTLPLLSSLQLSGNCITSNGLSHLAKTLEKDPNQALKELRYLNLSFNPLGNSSSLPLATCLDHLVNLRQLTLESCRLDENFLQQKLISSLKKSNLSEVLIGYNDWTSEAMAQWTRTLNLQKIEVLSIPGTKHWNRAFSHFSAFAEPEFSIRELDFSACQLDDQTFEQFLKILGRFLSLQKIQVRSNPKVTLDCLSSFLEQGLSSGLKMEEICFTGYKSLPMEGSHRNGLLLRFQEILEKFLRSVQSFRKLELSLENFSLRNSVEDLWVKVYENRGVVQDISSEIVLFTSNN